MTNKARSPQKDFRSFHPTAAEDLPGSPDQRIFVHFGRFSGALLAALFYTGLNLAPADWPAVALLNRYFLGHPIAIVTTVLFWIAFGQLAGRALQTRANRKLSLRLSDRDLVPDELHSLAGLGGPPNPSAFPSSPGGPPTPPYPISSHESLAIENGAKIARHLGRELIPAGLVRSMDRSTPMSQRIEVWLRHLGELPSPLRASQLVQRMTEVLDRQSRRGNADALNDDLRELSDHHADADHDSLQFVRIIVWAIPMLGFLGTVVGITQTLGGLDFTDGAAAVERLKNGLYVAFDTTAVALVLSVLAIFIQFPIEKSGQRLSQQVEKRFMRLFPSILASDISVTDADDPFAVLKQMTREISQTIQTSVQLQADVWKQTVDAAHDHWENTAALASSQVYQLIEQAFGEKLQIALRSHTEALRSIQREGADQIDHRWHQWQTCLSDNARVLLAHQKALIRLNQSMDTVQNGIQAATGSANLADAMMTLAKAVDVLADRIPDSPPDEPTPHKPTDGPTSHSSPAETEQLPGRVAEQQATRPTRRNAA